MTTTHDTMCTEGGQRGERLVAYLYDDLDSSERAAIESHLSRCRRCREELAALGAVRVELGRWTPPEPARGFASSPPALPRKRPGVWGTLSDIPVWTQAAAAVLCVGVAAGLANVEVRYDGDGLMVRTGWSGSSAPGGDVASAGETVAAPAVERPWQVDLAELAEALRSELRTGRTAASGQAAESGAGVTQVRALIDESEQRQRRELALRLAEVLRDVESQRRDDIEKIGRSLGVIQANLGVMQNTGVEVMRQRQMINDLAVRVSQR
jgi:hypothetical protein